MTVSKTLSDSLLNDPLAPAFVAIIAGGILWLLLVGRLFAMLKARAPEAYAAIGRPHLIWNNSISNGLLFTRFLLSGAYNEVDDEGVRKLCGFLRPFFWGYLGGFIGLTGAFVLSIVPRG